jgi:hypothetical protein
MNSEVYQVGGIVGQVSGDTATLGSELQFNLFVLAEQQGLGGLFQTGMPIASVSGGAANLTAQFQQALTELSDALAPDPAPQFQTQMPLGSVSGGHVRMSSQFQTALRELSA